jgi:hypothetical protein
MKDSKELEKIAKKVFGSADVNSGLPENFVGELQITAYGDITPAGTDSSWLPVTVRDEENTEYQVNVAKLCRLNGSWGSTKVTKRLEALFTAIDANKASASIDSYKWEPAKNSKGEEYIRKSLKGSINLG